MILNVYIFFAIRLAVDHHLIDILSFKFAQVYVVRIRVVIWILPNQCFVEFCLGHAFFVISNLTGGRKLQVLHRLQIYIHILNLKMYHPIPLAHFDHMKTIVG